MRQQFSVPFSRLGTTDLRVPLSANPRYEYDRQHSVVRVTHDPLPQLAHDAMPVRGRRYGARDQEAGGERRAAPAEVQAFLKEHLDPEAWEQLCEMIGADPGDGEEVEYDEEGSTREGDFENHKLPFGAQDSAHRDILRRYPHFDRLKFAGG